MKNNTVKNKTNIRRSLIESVESRRLLAALVSSTTLNGSIQTDSEVDNHTITVSAGDPLIVALGNPGSGGFEPRMQVISPGNSVIANVVAGIGLGQTVNLIAPQTGTYTVRISEDGQDATGNYTVTAFALGTQVDSDTGLVESGRRFASVVSPGDLDAWTLTATPGQLLSVIVSESTAGDNMEVSVVLVAPDGSVIASQNNSAGLRIDHTALQSGTYYAIVSESGADESGVYGITFTRLPGPQYAGDPDTSFLASGNARTVNLPSGDADVWSFYADAGVSINSTLAAVSGSSLNPQLLLYGPGGALLDSQSGSASASVSATAPTSGNYWIVGRDTQSDTGGSANFIYALSSGTGAGPIVNGVLTVNGTSGDDRIILTRTTTNLNVSLNGTTNTFQIADILTINLYSLDGNDKVDLAGIDINTYVSAGGGDDTVIGGSGKDSITGGAGKNRLYGGGGDDRLNGSNGRDFMYGDGGNDRLYGNAGNDYLDGGGNVDRIYGGEGDDSLIGGSSNDKMYGEAGADTLTGGSGADVMNGDDGNDSFFARDSSIDIIDGGSGTDLGNLDSNDEKTSVEVIG